jgi:hypothetical protein
MIRMCCSPDVELERQMQRKYQAWLKLQMAGAQQT